MSTRRYHLLNAFLLIILFAGSAWAYPRLPARIPIHFGVSGQPDAWAGRSLASWFMLPAVAAALAVLLRAAGAYSASHPELWNLPEKRAFLRLDAAAQAPIIARMQALLALVGVMVTGVLGIVQVSIYRASTGTATALPGWTLAVIGVLVLGMVAAGLRSNRVVAGMVRDARARAAE